MNQFWFPHSHCVLDDGFIIALDSCGNILTALAYYITPLILGTGVIKLWKLLRWSERLLFIHGAAFIATCGFTHILKAWNWWHANYMLEAIACIVNGVVSITFSAGLAVYFIKRLYR